MNEQLFNLLKSTYDLFISQFRKSVLSPYTNKRMNDFLSIFFNFYFFKEENEKNAAFLNPFKEFLKQNELSILSLVETTFIFAKKRTSKLYWGYSYDYHIDSSTPYHAILFWSWSCRCHKKSEHTMDLSDRQKLGMSHPALEFTPKQWQVFFIALSILGIETFIIKANPDFIHDHEKFKIICEGLNNHSSIHSIDLSENKMYELDLNSWIQLLEVVSQSNNLSINLNLNVLVNFLQSSDVTKITAACKELKPKFNQLKLSGNELGYINNSAWDNFIQFMQAIEAKEIELNDNQLHMLPAAKISELINTLNSTCSISINELSKFDDLRKTAFLNSLKNTFIYRIENPRLDDSPEFKKDLNVILFANFKKYTIDNERGLTRLILFSLWNKSEFRKMQEQIPLKELKDEGELLFQRKLK